MSRRVTVFDFDGTLTRDDTFISFACHALGKWNLFRGIVRNIPHLVRWKLGMVEGSYAKEKLYSTLYKGKSKEKIREAAHDFIPEYREEMIEILKRHVESGDKVYLITASLDLWMRDIADTLKVSLICTLTSVNSDGLLDGKFASPNCYGGEKLKRLLKEENNLYDCYLTVYGNEPGGGDASLFKIADKGIAVTV